MTDGVDSRPAGCDSDKATGCRAPAAVRLSPLVIAYVDRIKVSFANLRMSADLGFNIATLYLVAAALVIGLRLQQPARAVAGIAQPD